MPKVKVTEDTILINAIVSPPHFLYLLVHSIFVNNLKILGKYVIKAEKIFRTHRFRKFCASNRIIWFLSDRVYAAFYGYMREQLILVKPQLLAE
jgi:hypothetical protein